MLIQLGWIYRALKHDDKPTTEVELKELKRKGRSVFLSACLQVAATNELWPEHQTSGTFIFPIALRHS
jgi:hypothetical protein